MNYMNRNMAAMGISANGAPVSDTSQILQALDQSSFALDDVTLYLDTHPMDRDALNYYQYVKSLRNQAMNAYMDQYGPLMKDQENSTTSWTWVKGPWPWEGGND